MKKALLGAAYGIVLCGIGMMAAGAGHGTYIFVILASAPVWALTNAGPIGVGISLLAIPVLWFVVGLLLNGKSRQKTAVFLTIMLVHYASAVWLLLADRQEWRLTNQMLAVLGFSVYLLGQIVVWWAFAGNIRSNKSASG